MFGKIAIFMLGLGLVGCGPVASPEKRTSRLGSFSNFVGDSALTGSGFEIPGKLSCSCNGRAQDCVAVSFNYAEQGAEENGDLLPTHKYTFAAHVLDKYPKVSGGWTWKITGCDGNVGKNTCRTSTGSRITAILTSPATSTHGEKEVSCVYQATESDSGTKNY